MKRIAYILILACLLSCSTPQMIATKEQVKVIEHTELVPVTVELTVPEIRESVTTRDTSSHLENDYAISDAIVHRDGSLEHTLATRPRRVPQSVTVPVSHKDSIVYVNTETEKIIEVEKPLSWWQRVRLDSFFILVILLLWAYRKQIVKLIKTITIW